MNRESNCFYLLHQNIAGILSKKELIEITLDEQENGGRCFHVLCFSETFIRLGSERNVHINGFRLASSFSRTGQKRGGVCILCKENILIRKLDFLDEFAEEQVFECCGIEIQAIKCFVICIYRTPTSNLTTFLHKFELLLNRLKQKINRKIVITGDLNIDILKTSKASDDLTRIVTNNSFKLHVKVPTRKKACLDQVISNIPTTQCEVLNLGLSDHETAQTLKFEIDNKLNDNQYWVVKKRDYSLENISKFRECMKSLS